MKSGSKTRRPPSRAYHALVERGEIREDPAQLRVLPEFDRLWRALERPSGPGLVGRLLGRAQPCPKGLYLWGDVGRGKTWLMDLFLELIDDRKTVRAHFHRFMARVHDSLRRLETERDPLPRIAREWACECDVLCFDEFYVADIADAMLLGRLLQALLDQGILLVATSNVHPDDLYRDGLQRARFVPAIACIKRHCRVLELAGEKDHRLRILEGAGVFHDASAADAEEALAGRFRRFSGGEDLSSRFQVNGRTLQARRRGLGTVWFDFAELCREARSPLDYIEIARDFNTLLLSDVPVLDDASADAVRRFISLVDELYDRNVKLVLSAAAPAAELYTGQRLEFEFRRTRSRLTEMQSHEYLSRPHVP